MNWEGMKGHVLFRWMFWRVLFGLQLMMINNQTGREGGQARQERRRVDLLLIEQHVSTVRVNNNPHQNKNDGLPGTNEANHQHPPARPILKQPLPPKFQGIIINKVLRNIYSKNQRECLQWALESLRNIRHRLSPLKPLSLEDIQRRTMIVLIRTTAFLIEQYQHKLMKQGLSALQLPLI